MNEPTGTRIARILRSISQPLSALILVAACAGGLFAQAPTITTTSLPTGGVGGTYAATLQATGGTAPFTWTLTGGSLPSGLTLSPAG